MRTFGMILLTVFGILTLPAMPWLGVPMVGMGIWLGARAGHEDVTRFMGALFLLGVVGFALSFVFGGPPG